MAESGANSPLRVAIDIGGVLSKYRELVRLAVVIGTHWGCELYVLTDMPKAQAVAMLRLNGWEIPEDRVIACNYAVLGERCKAEACRALGIDILIDDHVGYVAIPGAPPVRLLVMPDPDRDYYHPDWKTDDSEGDFGRVVAVRAGAEDGGNG